MTLYDKGEIWPPEFQLACAQTFSEKKNFKIRYFMQKERERIIYIIMMSMTQFSNEDIWIKIEFFFMYNVKLD